MLNVIEQPNSITVEITGRLDHRSVTEFKQLFGKSPPLWIVDMSGVSYVDSSALGVLLLLREQVSNDPKRVHLRGLQGQPKAVLTIAKFDRLFTMI